MQGVTGAQPAPCRQCNPFGSIGSCNSQPEVSLQGRPCGRRDDSWKAFMEFGLSLLRHTRARPAYLSIFARISKRMDHRVKPGDDAENEATIPISESVELWRCRPSMKSERVHQAHRQPRNVG